MLKRFAAAVEARQPLLKVETETSSVAETGRNNRPRRLAASRIKCIQQNKGLKFGKWLLIEQHQTPEYVGQVVAVLQYELADA